MHSSKFKITLKGDEADDSIRLSDLIDQLNAVKQVLNQLDVSVSGKRQPSLYYKIVGINMNSPATFEVEAVSRADAMGHGRKVISKFQRDLKSVIAGKRPKEADLELLESYGGLVAPMRRHMAEVSMRFNETSFELPRNLGMKVDEILGPDQVEHGSIVGSLDVIDIHNQRNQFKIYPVVGPTSVRCNFAKGMLNDAIAGINHFVRIYGELRFKRTEKFPHLINVSRIEVLPEKSDAPSLLGLRGLAPGALEGKSSVEFIQGQRDGEW